MLFRHGIVTLFVCSFWLSSSLQAQPLELDIEISALLAAADQAEQENEFDKLLTLTKSAKDLGAKIYGENSRQFAALLFKYGIAYSYEGREQEAEPIVAQATELIKKHFGIESERASEAMSSYTRLLTINGKLGVADRLSAEQLKISTIVLGPYHPRTITRMIDRASLLSQISRQYLQGRPPHRLQASEKKQYFDTQKEIRDLYAKARYLRRNIVGALHPRALKLAMGAQGLTATGIAMLEGYDEFGRSPLETSEAALVDALDEGPQSSEYAWANLEHAMVLDKFSRFDEAAGYFEQAYAIFASLNALPTDIPTQSINGLANNLVIRDRSHRALKLLEDHYKSIQKDLGPADIRQLTTLSNLAAVQLASGQIERAQQLAHEAVELSVQILGETHPTTISVRNNRAVIAAIAGESGNAIAELEKVLLLEKEYIWGTDLRMALFLQNLAVARLANDSQRHLAAGPAKQAIQKITAHGKRIGFNATLNRQYALNMTVHSTAFKIMADAIYSAVSEESQIDDETISKILILLQQATVNPTTQALADNYAKKRAADLGPRVLALVERRHKLIDDWNYVQTSLASELINPIKPDTDLIAGSRKQTKDMVERIGALNFDIDEVMPDFFQLIRPEPLDLTASQALLKPDEAVLIIVPSEFGTHIVALTHERAKWHRSDQTSFQVGRKARRLLWDVGANVDIPIAESLEWEQQGEGVYPYDRKTAFSLYTELVEPLSQLLAGKRHVFIAASDSLSSLPFGILVTEAPTGRDGDPEALRGTKWFADQHALIQIPSIQSLAFLRERASPIHAGERLKFMGFGDPVLTGQADIRGKKGQIRGRDSSLTFSQLFRGNLSRSGTALKDIEQLRTMARLPGTARELQAMREALHAPQQSIKLANNATEQSFKSANLSNVDILALATHGLLAGEISGAAEPGLVFTPPAEPTELDDGLLTSSEVAGLEINADWVILSACNTASGDGSSGAPGLSGLARAFFFAGAKNLLASHWPVRDDVSAKLTVRTLEIAENRKNLSRAEAFQRAMSEIRNDRSADSDNDTWAHPNAWAPFTLIGDHGSVAID